MLEVLDVVILLALGVIPEIIVGVGLWNKMQRKGIVDDVLADKWKPAIDKVVQPLKDSIDKIAVQVNPGEGLEARLDNLETSFDEFGAAMAADMNKLPGQMQSVVMQAMGSIRANETIELQKMMQSLGVDQAMQEESEGFLAQPEFMKSKFMQKMMAMGVSEAYAEKNPLGALLFEGAKIKAFEWLQEGQGEGTKKGPRGRGGNSPYG